MRALTLLKNFVEWRWTPCVAIIASSLLYVLVAIIVVPSEIDTGSHAKEASGKSVGVVEGMEPPTNSFATNPRRPMGGGLNPPMNPVVPLQEPAPMAAPPPPPDPPAPPPPEEPQREEPPPPPPPAPPPPPVQEEEEEEAPEPAPTAQAPPINPPQNAAGRARFMASPLRFMPPGSNPNPDGPPPAPPPEGQ